MYSAFHQRRSGMTLIELLVVIGIIGALAVAVLPNLGTTVEARRGRESARMLTSFIAKAQARAIGRREWSGFMLTPVSASSYAVADLFLADVPPVYRGDTVPAMVTITGAASASRQAVWNDSALFSFITIGGTTGDLIRFGGRDRWYEVSGLPPENAVSGTLSFQLRGHSTGAVEDSGYQPHNTPWPASPPGGIPFEILRQPMPAGSPFTFPDARVVDLYWSGYGPPQVGTTATYQPFQVGTTGTATAGATTSILYDGTGRLRQIHVRAASGSPRRLTVTGPVFLLLGRADRVGQAYDSAAGGADDSVGANWQYADSHWIAIDPFTGAVRSAECVPTATTVIESQQWIRQVLLTGGG